jgi:hypothetical protein
MKNNIRIFICVLLAFAFFSCRNDTILSGDQKESAYWPAFDSYSLLWPRASGFRVMIQDSVYNEEDWEDPFWDVYISTSSGDEEKLKLRYDHNYWMIVGGSGLSILFNGGIVQYDGKLQFNGRERNDGWLLVKYRTRYEDKQFYWRYVWEVE